MKRLILAAGIAVAATAAAHAGGDTPFGKPADAAKASRTIDVAMSDTMRFAPSAITVKRGDIVRFIARNDGKLVHEMVLGTMNDLRAHAEMMRKHAAMGHQMDHDEPGMLRVAPGKSGTMAWQFTRAGKFHFGCLEPGHFEAGMVGTIAVTDK